MGPGTQVVRPPQRGIFPLDHGAECRETMQAYLQCLEENEEMHHKCRDYSQAYLQCRMDHQLMSKEKLEDLGFSDDHKVEGAREYDKSKEKAGFVAGKHVEKNPSKWFWQEIIIPGCTVACVRHCSLEIMIDYWIIGLFIII